MLDKSYSPQATESSRYQQWEDSGVMASNPSSPAQPYTIMMPPPNVTGNLHIGHALTFTLQDILIRYKRMLGLDVLWQPGTDHAGIATQMVVERQLDADGITRHQLGREAFLEKVWEWKAHSGGNITTQLRRLGASPDWKRERFTLDEGLSKAVQKVFVDLHRKGLIYRDKRLVNWDPKLQTAISDLEVENREAEGSLWVFKYPLTGRSGEFITIATTRPETLFGDTAVAVHPEDERYTHLVGTTVDLPLTDRKIPIVADSYADPEKGTGAVKITPAHDFNDFEVGKRHNLERLNILDSYANLNDNVPEAYRGLDRFEARKRVIEDMKERGLFVEETKTTNAVPYGDRSGVVIEPWLTDQWYVDAATLAAPALKAVEDGQTRFVPEYWTATYYEWLRNIQPWCISRQLWWGHRIPAWYGPDGKAFVALSESDALNDARAFYNKSDVTLTQDEDVLDTWFSSALWPFSTLGWPEKTPELDKYYPTNVLVTGNDIIFFWVARMMMMGLHFTGKVPFKDIYIHALVRDDKGQKMSKSKGNVVDPLELIDQYGADALRFTMAALAAPGRDVRFSTTLVEGHRNFATKLWNVSRFCEMNECRFDPAFDPASASSSLNRWIVAESLKVERLVSEALDAYKFNEASSELYQFIWGTFCDWYIEFCKPEFMGDSPHKAETQKTVAWVLDRILHLLHPFMPFITETLWQDLRGSTDALMTQSWTANLEVSEASESDCQDINWLIKVITEIRSVRAEMNVAPKTLLNLTVYEAGSTTKARIQKLESFIKRLARVETITLSDAALTPQEAEGALQTVIGEATFALPLKDTIDVGAERDRLNKEIVKITQEIGGLERKLGNQDFIARAPEEVVQENKNRLAAAMLAKDKLSSALDRLQA